MQFILSYLFLNLVLFGLWLQITFRLLDKVHSKACVAYNNVQCNNNYFFQRRYHHFHRFNTLTRLKVYFLYYWVYRSFMRSIFFNISFWFESSSSFLSSGFGQRSSWFCDFSSGQPSSYRHGFNKNSATNLHLGEAIDSGDVRRLSCSCRPVGRHRQRHHPRGALSSVWQTILCYFNSFPCNAFFS